MLKSSHIFTPKTELQRFMDEFTHVDALPFILCLWALVYNLCGKFIYDNIVRLIEVFQNKKS